MRTPLIGAFTVYRIENLELPAQQFGKPLNIIWVKHLSLENN